MAVERSLMEEQIEGNGTVPVGNGVQIKEERAAPSEIDRLVADAQQALEAMRCMSQEEIDKIVQAMAVAGAAAHVRLARMAVDETGMGVYEDKVIKNLFATEYVYNAIRNQKTVGVLGESPEDGLAEVADPVGVIAGITPVTNPTSTTLFKSLIAIKTRNPIVFSFHPKAVRCSAEAASVMRDAAVAAGAPEGCIAWLEQTSIEATQALMRHPGVALILATGGAGMVEAAYSSGKPALGVGPGNVPAYIHKSADLKQAVNDILLSKTFDNGTVCASEQAVIVDSDVAEEVRRLFESLGARFLEPDEIRRLETFAIDPKRCSMAPQIVGQPATRIAEMAKIDVPPNTKVLIAELEGVGPEYPLSREKLSPILAFYTVPDQEEGIRRCEQMTEFGGLGHTAVIHAKDEAAIQAFSERVRTGRLLVNSPSSQGAIGDLYNRNTPSLTLGCGTMGHNATTDNVGIRNLLNVKRVAARKPRMKWFRVPPEIYFERGSLDVLSTIPERRAFIVTDEAMVKLGYVEAVRRRLERAGIASQVFSGVEPDPSVETVDAGTRAMERFQPDLIIALGGGSPMDAAKGMWLFYEYPGTRFEELRLKFMDIRKRTWRYPGLGRRARFVAIPTTSGTGSEVTAFAVITDKKANVKYPLADYELTPDIAIVDPELVRTVPPQVTADTGIDTLVHAIEAYVSVMASDYSDALALRAIELVFQYLPRAYRNGEHDEEARERMHNAATIAGMAFTNAFLGINHSLAHILGARFHIAHGRANAILLPHVIRYNAGTPTKLATFPQYEWPRAGERYADIARRLGLPAETVEQGVDSLIAAIQKLLDEVGIPKSVAAVGVDAEAYENAVPGMADIAYNDQCTISNPRQPLVHELADILRKAYVGMIEGDLCDSTRGSST